MLSVRPPPPDPGLPQAPQRRFRRGIYLLPSLFTLANMFCGYASIVYTMRTDYETAAQFIGFAIVLDMLDGWMARLTGTTSAFGREFDSLADVISFGLAPAILAFAWGLAPLRRLGWAVGFIFVTAAAMRLARFNIQSSTVDKRYFVGMPSPAAAGVAAATVFAFPGGLENRSEALPALAMMLVPAVLMVSTIRYRSFKGLDVGLRRSYITLLLFAAALAAIVTHPQVVLIVMAYTYLVSAFVGLAIARLRRRGPDVASQRAAPHEAP